LHSATMLVMRWPNRTSPVVSRAIVPPRCAGQDFGRSPSSLAVRAAERHRRKALFHLLR
jgi:hypothetical protein